MTKKRDVVGGGVVDTPPDYSELKGGAVSLPMERLTVSLEGGTTYRLRSLAGGERKVGAFLSDVAAWLWTWRETLAGAPLQDFAPVLQEWIPRVVVSPEEQNAAKDNADRLRSELDELEERLRRLDENINTLESRRNAGATMDAVGELPQ